MSCLDWCPSAVARSAPRGPPRQSAALTPGQRRTADRAVQQIDKDSGLPLWVIEVIDPQENTRQRTVKVMVATPVQPVLPAPAPGSPFTAVEFEGMTATPYVDASRCQGKGKCGARQAYEVVHD